MHNTLRQILEVLKNQDKKKLADDEKKLADDAKKLDDKRKRDRMQFFSAMSVVVRLYPCSRIIKALNLLQL